MLTGTELGAAIASAIEKKINGGFAKSKAEIARHFEIAAPTIYDWTKRGTISKDKLPKLWDYFSDVVDLDHWGVDGCWPFKKVSYERFLKLPETAKDDIETIIISRCNEHLGLEDISIPDKTAA